MPHIVMKRNDIPNGTLQVLDLVPNTSQRNLTIDPPGQTKYINAPLNEATVTTGAGPVSTYVGSRGLSAWFLTNVPAVAGVAASQTGTVGLGGTVAGETITVGATVFTVVAAAPGVNEILAVVNPAQAALQIANAINNPANGTAGIVTAINSGADVIVTAVTQGVAGNAIATTDTSVAFGWAGATLVGGVDAAALTAAQANQIASDILTDLVRFGDNSLPSLAVDLAGVNAVIALVVPGCVVLAAQISEILDILSGRLYVLPKGVQIEDASNVWSVSPAVGTATGPRFIDPSTRHTYESGALTISWFSGQLAGFRDPGFVYKEVAGSLLVVYDDDGALFAG